MKWTGPTLDGKNEVRSGKPCSSLRKRDQQFRMNHSHRSSRSGRLEADEMRGCRNEDGTRPFCISLSSSGPARMTPSSGPPHPVLRPSHAMSCLAMPCARRKETSTLRCFSSVHAARQGPSQGKPKPRGENWKVKHACMHPSVSGMKLG